MTEINLSISDKEIESIELLSVQALMEICDIMMPHGNLRSPIGEYEKLFKQLKIRRIFTKIALIELLKNNLKCAILQDNHMAIKYDESRWYSCVGLVALCWENQNLTSDSFWVIE